MLESGFKAPRDEAFKVVGKAGYANMMAQIANLHEGGFISDHDRLCVSRVARVMTVSAVEENSIVNSRAIMDLESAGFLELLATEKTQERIEFTLRNNKPLRN